MNNTSTLIYDTLVSLASLEPEQHAEIRQNLYDELGLTSDQQFALYSCALGPASSGKIQDKQSFSEAVSSALKVIETPEY